MRTSSRAWSVVIAVLLSVLVVAVPLAAAPGNPTLDYLQTTIKPLLDAISASIGALQTAVSTVQSSVTSLQSGVSSLQSGVTSLQSSATQLLSNLTTVQNTVAAQPALHVVKTEFTTLPGTTSAFNLDVHSLPIGTFERIKKYSVTLYVKDPFTGAPSGMDRIDVIDTALDGATSYDVSIAGFDPTASRQLVLQPYVGTDSFIRVTRGADGLGPLAVVVNAYIESEP